MKQSHAIRSIFGGDEGARKFVLYLNNHMHRIWIREKRTQIINEHFKDIDSQCTQNIVHNKLFLLIINQFYCYYHPCDHYSQRSIERVAMNFFKKLFYKRMKGTACLLSLHIASSFFIYRDAMCKHSRHTVLLYCGEES